MFRWNKCQLVRKKATCLRFSHSVYSILSLELTGWCWLMWCSDYAAHCRATGSLGVVVVFTLQDWLATRGHTQHNLLCFQTDLKFTFSSWKHMQETQLTNGRNSELFVLLWTHKEKCIPEHRPAQIVVKVIVFCWWFKVSSTCFIGFSTSKWAHS